MKQILKIIAGIIVICGVLYCLLWWFMAEDYRTRINLALQYTTLELLQIPYANTSTRNIFKDGWQDLEPISQEEWMSMECECPDTKTGQYDVWLPSATKRALNMLGTRWQKHIMCLQPYPFRKRGFVNIMPEDCPNMLQCESMRIQVYDYVLKYPKVLNNLIKIVEKPCFYLKYLPKEIPPSKSDLELGGIPFEYSFNKQTRGDLYCNNNRMPRSIIRILDKEGRAKYDIVVPRLDTAKFMRK